MRMIVTPTRRALRRVILLGSLAAWLVTGCIGLVRGDYYAGLSTGGLEACVPFNFDVSIQEGGRIHGLAATTYSWGTAAWDVTGIVTDRNIILETQTADPRVQDRLIRWQGRQHAISLEITEVGSRGSCPAPRTATLQRK